MSQVSRPMQFMLAGVLVFAAVWFVAIKPKDEAVEPVAASPAVTTPAPAAAGGAEATSTMGKAAEAAGNAANAANAATAQREQATGENSPTTPAATTPAAGDPAATTPAGTTPPAAEAAKAKKAAAKERAAARRDAQQRRADRVVKAIGKHLAARRAVVVLVAGSTGTEDRILRTRVTKEIRRRAGRVRTYVIPVSKVGMYEGLLGSLNLSQTPSTIVIAPNNEAKVLGGLVSTERIDRLTSAALQLKPAATTP